MKGIKAYLAEAIGTCILVVLGCGVAMFIGNNMAMDPAAGVVGIALAFGLSIIATAYVIGSISGCHINPAVSFAMLLSGKMGTKDFWSYVAAQIIGAIVGTLILIEIAASAGITFMGNLGQNGFGPGYGVGLNAWGALLTEVVLTFVFCFTILGVTSDESRSRIAGVVIGFTLVLVHLLGINLTGTSVNPARSLGPALFAGTRALSQLWVFIVGPLVGAAVAAFTFRFLNSGKDKPTVHRK